jgi:glucose-6-phosphate 1-epimerase
VFSFKTNEKGLKYIEIQNAKASAKIAVQGAHIFHYQREGEEPILWLSPESFMEHGEHIRGGVPICWPSFGMNNPELPQHGFARNRMWDLVNIIEENDNETVLIMEFRDSKGSRKVWDFKFRLEAKFTISEKLTIELTTHNVDTKTFTFTQALHTYFNVSEISDVSISGLQNKPCLDTVINERFVQEGELVIDKEIDLVFQEVDKDIILKDANREVKIQAEGSNSCIVWNPWIEKTKKMSGLADERYHEFVCIETANAYEDYKILDAGESHTLKAVICYT